MIEFLAALMLFVGMIPGILLRYLPFRSLVNRRQRVVLIASYLILGLVHVTVMMLLFRWKGFKGELGFLTVGGTAYAVLAAMVNMLVIRGRFREHGFVFGIVLCCNYILMYIPVYFVRRIGMDPVLGFFVTDGIYIALLAAAVMPLRWLLHRTVEQFLHLDTSDYWQTTWIIPVLLFLSMFTSFAADGEPKSLLQLIGRALFVLVVVFICFSIAKNHKNIGQKKIMEAQLAAQKQHYTDLLAQVERARQQRHDMKHHVAAILHYIDTKDIDGLSRYFSGYSRQQEETVSIPYTGNSAVDAVLYHYLRRAVEHNVQLTYAGTIRNCDISDIDLSALLGNALENALEACMRLEQGRTIEVILQSRELMTSILVRNSFDGTVLRTGPHLLSRKRQGKQQGLGIRSMQEICRRCGGNMEYTWDDKCFTVLVLLPGRE